VKPLSLQIPSTPQNGVCSNSLTKKLLKDKG
jgi:hypothetical protein